MFLGMERMSLRYASRSLPSGTIPSDLTDVVTAALIESPRKSGDAEGFVSKQGPLFQSGKALPLHRQNFAFKWHSLAVLRQLFASHWQTVAYDGPRLAMLKQCNID